MALLVASKLIAAGRGLAPALVRRAATVELDWDTRQKSRFEATDSTGRRVAVFLARGRIVRGGDVLVAEDGSLIAVKAAAQAILVVTVAAGRRRRSTCCAPRITSAIATCRSRCGPIACSSSPITCSPRCCAAWACRSRRRSGPFEPEAGAYDTASSGHGHVHAEGSGRP